MNDKEQLVSVAMATYNGSKYLRQQLDSLLHQTWSTIEIVALDDSSSDDTYSILQEYSQRYSNIHVYQNASNLGVSKTFEKAASLCHGSFIAFADQDDVWMPEKIKVLMDEIGDHDVVFSNSLLVNENGESLGIHFSSLMKLQSYYSGTAFLLSNTIPGHNMLANASFLKRIMPFPSDIYFDLWISYNAGAGNGMKYVDKVLTLYRQHETNSVGTKFSGNKNKRLSKKKRFERKKNELITLAGSPVNDPYTKDILNQMIRLFSRGLSLKRSIFFFRNFEALLGSKQKPYMRKLMYCMKMFFKPNF